MKFEDLLDVIGEFDAYQWQVLIIMSLISIAPNESAAINFIALPVKHWCKVAGLEHLPKEIQRLFVAPFDHATGQPDGCKMWDINYTQALNRIQEHINASTWNADFTSEISNDSTVFLDNSTWSLWQDQVTNATPILCVNWMYNVSSKYDSIRASWDLVCHREWLVDISSSVYMAGLLVGSLVSGSVSDRYGRLKGLWIFQAIKMIGAFMAAFSPNMPVFLISRFILSFGGMANHLCRYVLLMEVAGTRSRTKLLLLYNISGIFATGLLTFFAYYISNYIYLQLSLALPLLLHFIAYPFLYESPRWLLVQGRYKEAEHIIQRISRRNKKPLPAGLNISDVDARTDKEQATMTDLFTYPVMRKRASIISLHWLADCLLYYAIIFNIGSLPGNIYVNMLAIALVDIPVIAICWFFLQWRVTGRRLTCALLLIFTGIAGFVEIPLTLLNYERTLTIVSLFICMTISSSFSSIYVFAAELYPTQVRNTGMGFSSTCARLGSLSAPFIGPWLAAYWKPLPSLIFALLGTITGCLTFILPETLGRKLPETLHDAEHFRTDKATNLKVYEKKMKEVHSFPLLNNSCDEDDDVEEDNHCNENIILNRKELLVSSDDEI